MTRSTLAYLDPSAADGGALTTPAPPASGVRPRSGYSRSRATVERRTPVLRSAPARAGDEPSGVLFDPASIAPFDHAPEHVPARTRAVIVCPASRAAEHAAGCEACGDTGLVVTWVEIEIQREQRTLVSGSGPARERHRNALAPEDFEIPTAWPNQLLHQAWFRGLPRHLAPELSPALASNERILWLLVQTFVG